jgi:hypothetical protein
MKSVTPRSAFGRRVAATAVLGLAAATLSLGVAGPASAVGEDLQGTVTGVGGVPLPDIHVTAYDSTGSGVETVTTDAAGHYALSTLSTAPYKIRFADGSTTTISSALPYLTRWSDGAKNIVAASAVNVVADAGGTLNMALSERYGAVAGTLTFDGRTLDDPALSRSYYAFDSTGEDLSFSLRTAGAAYRFLVPPGDYKVAFEGWDNAASPATYFIRQFWRNADTLDTATVVSVGSGQTVGGLGFALTKTLAARSAPQIVGIPAVGRPLSALPGTWSRAVNVDYTYTWLRGTTVLGTGPVYVPTAADFGSRLSVLVRANATTDSYYGNVGEASSAQSDIVRWPADARGRAKALGAHKALFSVKIVSAKQSPVRGKVVVLRGTKVVHKAVKLVKGKAVIVVKHQPKGKQVFTVVYKGNSLLSKAMKDFTVRVR